MKNESRLGKIGVYAALIMLSLPALLPLLWMVSTSLKTNTQIFAGGDFTFKSLIPAPFIGSNYPDALHNMPFLLYLRNTLLYGTYLPLIVPAFTASAYYVFLLTQFFKTLPGEMSEAACVDGANEWMIFTRLVLPLSKPALATCALFQFIGTWNDFLGPLLYVNDPAKYPLAYGLQQFVSHYGGFYAQLMAAATIFTLPIIVLFFFAQKTFIQGIATTGGK